MAVFRVEKNKGYTRYEQSPPAKQRTDAKSKGLDNPNTPVGDLMKELIFFILH